jgi:predicted nucleic acid-binding protein
MKLPDAIIAATALVYDLTLISRNAADFKNIQGLKAVDPHSL